MKKVLLLLLFMFAFIIANAQSYSGGQIQVENLGDSIFKTTVYYVKNCLSCRGDKTCDVPDELTIAYGTSSSTTVNLKIVSSESTPISKCAKCNGCSSDSCWYPYGYTTFKLEGLVSLAIPINLGYCEFRAKVNVGQLDTTINTIERSTKSITLSNTFNACIKNSTPTSNYFGELICLGRKQIQNLASNPVDLNKLKKEIDKVVYSLTPLMHDKQEVLYKSSYSYDAPVYYSGFPGIGLEFPKGFNLDDTNGDLYFQPLKSGNVIFRIKMDEYRDGVLLSSSEKDIYYQIAKCPSNEPPVISGINCTSPQPQNFKTVVAEGDTICFTICTTDKSKSDTTTIEWNKGIKGASFEIFDKSAQRQSAKFCWTPSSEDVSKFPYTFVVSSYDQGCPTPLFSARSFFITVLEKPKVEISKSAQNCGQGQIIAKSISGIGVSQFMYQINGRTIVKKGGSSDTLLINTLKNGYNVFTVTLIGENGQNNVYTDSIFSQGSSPFNTEVLEIAQCDNETIEADLNDALRSGTSFNWLYDNSNDYKKSFSESADKVYKVLGTFNGCSDTLDVFVNVLEFTQKIVAKAKSGNAPFNVEFILEGTGDAEYFVIDFGDGIPEKVPVTAFPYFHEYKYKGLYDLEYAPYNGRKNCNTKTVLTDYINIFPTGISEKPSFKLDIYPNPNKGYFVINTDDNIESIKAFSIEGKQVKVIALGKNEFNITDAVKGLYILEVAFTNEQMVKQILIID